MVFLHVNHEFNNNKNHHFKINTKELYMSKILIIEDEAAIRRVLKKIISEENDAYQVEEAEDGLAGIELIKNNDYDLVLCDIKFSDTLFKISGISIMIFVRFNLKIYMLAINMLKFSDMTFMANLKFCHLFWTTRYILLIYNVFSQGRIFQKI